MKSELVMLKEETKDYKEKAAMANKNGIASKLLPETKYKSRIRAIQEKNNQTENATITSTKSSHTSSNKKFPPQNQNNELSSTTIVDFQLGLLDDNADKKEILKWEPEDDQESMQVLQDLADLIDEELDHL